MFPPFDKIFGGGSTTAAADRRKNKKREKIDIGTAESDVYDNKDVGAMIDETITEVNPPLNESEVAAFGRDRKPGTVNIFVGKKGTEDEYEHIDEYRDRLKGVDSAEVAKIRREIKQSYGKKDFVVKDGEDDVEDIRSRMSNNDSDDLAREQAEVIKSNLNRIDEPRKKVEIVGDGGVVEISNPEDRLAQAVDDIRKVMSDGKTKEKLNKSHAEVISSSLKKASDTEKVGKENKGKSSEELWQEQFKENNIVDEVASGDKEEVFEVKMPHEIAQDLDKLASSENLVDHYKAAQILKDLDGDDVKGSAVAGEMSQETADKLHKMEVPEFGRREKRVQEESYADKFKKKLEEKREKTSKEKERNFAAEDKSSFVQFRKDEPDSRRRFDPSVKVEDKNSEAVFEVNIPVEENKQQEIGKEKGYKIIDRRSSGDLIKGIDGIDKNAKAGVENISNGQEELARTKAELSNMGPIPPRPETPEKAEGFWGKAKDVLSKPEFWKTLGKVGISSAASILGVKSFYDVPAYFRQRYAVRGNVMGIGSGKGLSGSIEELLEASQDRKTAIDRGQERNKGAVTEALKDFDKRLAMTKEGNQKHSEQRKMLAKLLWENRQQKKVDDEKRGNEIDNILDNYTTTKVSGVQAAREALNTAFVASGAFALRGVAYGALAYQEKADKLRKEATAAHMNGENGLDAVDAKKLAEKEVSISKVFATGFKETLDGIRFKTGKTGMQKSLSAAKSWGSVARLAGIALGVGMGGQAYGKAYDNLIDTISNGNIIGNAEKNFLANAERYIPNFGSLEAAPIEKKPEIGKIFPGETLEKVDAAVEKSKYLGGRSVWSEAEKQIASYRGTNGRMPVGDIDKVKDLINAAPEKYGLSAGADINKLELEQLQEIQWNKAISDAGLGKEIPAKVVAEEMPARPSPARVLQNASTKTVSETGVVAESAEAAVSKSLPEHSAGTDDELKNLHEVLYGKESVVRMNEVSHSQEPTVEMTVNRGTQEHIKTYIDQHNKELSELSKRVTDYYRNSSHVAYHSKSLHNIGEEVPAYKFWSDIEKMRKPIEEEFGGKISIDPAGSIRLKMADDSLVELFKAEGGVTPLAKEFLEKKSDGVVNVDIKRAEVGDAKVEMAGYIKATGHENLNEADLKELKPDQIRAMEQTSRQISMFIEKINDPSTPASQATTLRRNIGLLINGAEEKVGHHVFNDKIRHFAGLEESIQKDPFNIKTPLSANEAPHDAAIKTGAVVEDSKSGDFKVETSSFMKGYTGQENVNPKSLEGLDGVQQRTIKLFSVRLSGYAEKLKDEKLDPKEAEKLHFLIGATIKRAEESVGRENIFNDDIRKLALPESLGDNAVKQVTDNIPSSEPARDLTEKIQEQKSIKKGEDVTLDEEPLAKPYRPEFSDLPADSPDRPFLENQLKKVFYNEEKIEKPRGLARLFGRKQQDNEEEIISDIKTVGGYKDLYEFNINGQKYYGAVDESKNLQIAIDKGQLSVDGFLSALKHGRVAVKDGVEKIVSLSTDPSSSIFQRTYEEDSNGVYKTLVLVKAPEEISSAKMLGQENIDEDALNSLNPEDKAEVKATAHNLEVMEQEKEKAEKLAAMGNERAAGKAKSLEGIMSKVVKSEEDKHGPVFKDDIKVSAGLQKPIENIQKVERPIIQEEDLQDKKPEQPLSDSKKEIDFNDAFEDENGKEIDKEEPSDNAVQNSPRAFSPIRNTVLGDEQEAQSSVAEKIPTLSLAEAKNLNEPLSDIALIKSLIEQGKEIDLRNVPEISKDVLREMADQKATFNLLGLNPDKIDQEAALILNSFKGRKFLSDGVLQKIEEVASRGDGV